MSDTATWTGSITGGPVNEKAFTARAVTFVPALLLVLGVGAGTWWHFEGGRMLSRGEMESGAALALATAAGLVFWKSSRERRWKAKNDRLQQRVLELQGQLTETRRAKEGLQLVQVSLEKRGERLVEANVELREQLNKRNQAERAFSQRRLELESSKSVLELHVQERNQELQRLQGRYKMILNSAGEGICGLDLEGKATFANPAAAKLTGWSPEELIGKTGQEIFCSAQNGEKGLAGRSAGETLFCRKDGTSFPVEFVQTSITEGGRELGAVLVFKDISERKRVEHTLEQKASELARSNAELEQFAFVASHDLQEPLRKIQAFGDRLKVRCEGAQSPEGLEYLDRMQSAAARMRRLIDDLLAFSRVIQSSAPFVPVDLAVLAKEVLGDLEVRIEKSGARVEVEDLPTLEADAMQMRQLLLNLIGNALKFQPPGAVPVVRVAAESLTSPSGEPLCQLTIQDNGIGFDEKYLEKIFGVFQRLHGRGEYEGTGVGLAVCRRIVDRHHGSITARSKPGEGATFIVTLPLAQAGVQKVERGIDQSLTPAATNKNEN